MDYYGQKDFKEVMGIDGTHTIAEEGSFLVAQTNLIQKLNLGYEQTPVTLNAEYIQRGVYKDNKLRWNSPTKFDSTISIKSVGVGWPRSNEAIVKFYYQSLSTPTIIVDGAETPNLIYHYCAVAYYKKKLIIDSFDGEIKPSGPYGDPIGYAIYTTPELNKRSVSKPEYQYTWVTGDTIWEVGRRLHLDPVELLEHNDITVEQAGDIKPGTVIHLTAPRSLGDRDAITYDTEGYPKKMHVSHELGTHKIGFGKAKKSEDLLPVSRHYKYHENIEIVQKAHVPVGDEIYGFYMDALAVKSKQAMGFNHSHLTEGEWVEPEVLPEIETILDAPDEVLQVPFEVVEAPEPMEVEPEPNYNDWRTTYLPFINGNRLYVFKRNFAVRDYENPENREYFFRNDEIELTGTFIGEEGMKYGRLVRKENHFDWKCVPMSKVILEPYEEVYNTKLELHEKVAANLPITATERMFDSLARNAAILARKKIKK